MSNNSNSSRIITCNNFMKLEEANHLFDHLLELKPAEKTTITCYGKKCKTPRFIQAFGPDNYRFSGTTMIAKPLTKELKELKKLIQKKYSDTEWNFNNCLVNWYMNGLDSIGQHSDNESIIVPGSPIVGVTLGINSNRKLIIKRYSTKTTVVKVQLNHNSYYAMEGKQFQKTYTHGINKMKNSGPRISITFRCFHHQVVKK